MADKLYLEVAKGSGAILSYSNEQLKSYTSDFIEATETELNYLNAMEAKLPAGMITTLSDLELFRMEVKKIDQLEIKAAQLKSNVSRLQAEATQIKAQIAATQAKKDALLNAGAAKHGVTPAEYESVLIAQYSASKAGTGVPQTKSASTRKETAAKLAKFMADAKRKSYQ